MRQVDDLQLQREVDSVLWNSPYPELRSVSGHVANGGVRLRGLTESYFAKQVAQSLVRKIPGVRFIENNISVFAEHSICASVLDS
jgi:osmotically-inducible protein OsmY